MIRQICSELIIHTKLEEEIFYPACREEIDEEDLIQEAQVEHDSAKVLISDLIGARPTIPTAMSRSRGSPSRSSITSVKRKSPAAAAGLAIPTVICARRAVSTTTTGVDRADASRRSRWHLLDGRRLVAALAARGLRLHRRGCGQCHDDDASEYSGLHLCPSILDSHLGSSGRTCWCHTRCGQERSREKQLADRRAPSSAHRKGASAAASGRLRIRKVRHGVERG